MKYTIQQLPENYFAVCVGDKKLTLPLSETDARLLEALKSARGIIVDEFGFEAND